MGETFLLLSEPLEKVKNHFFKFFLKTCIKILLN